MVASVTVQSTIEEKLSNHLSLLHLQVVNESSNHNVPANSETHFKVSIVSQEFESTPLLARHRKINRILAAELEGPVHALAIHAFTEEEWRQRNGNAPLSPPCLGGS